VTDRFVGQSDFSCVQIGHCVLPGPLTWQMDNITKANLVLQVGADGLISMKAKKFDETTVDGSNEKSFTLEIQGTLVQRMKNIKFKIIDTVISLIIPLASQMLPCLDFIFLFKVKSLIVIQLPVCILVRMYPLC
uniref:Uncharacterized protein n=1 Tax=Oryzias latipes TaxID=8090 RepID=A0A3P9GYH5_ORYLA